jgi:hypothetical protein
MDSMPGRHLRRFQIGAAIMCDKQHELLKTYQRAVNTFSIALDAMEASRGCIGPEEYKRMEGYVEQARLNAEQARIDLERHKAEHGCSR